MVGSPLVIAEKARARLKAVLASVREGKTDGIAGQSAAAKLPASSDVIVTPCEVNELHGTGTLLLRIFSNSSSIVSLRTCDFYDGRQTFGAANFSLPLAQASGPEISSWLKWYLAGTSVRRILTIPYMPADVMLSLAVRESFGAPLCTYVMDDKNVCTEGISDPLMRELLSKSELRLAIGPEMRERYQDKYGLKFWVVPPLVPENLIRRTPIPMNGADPRRGVLLGNIWGQRWLDLLRSAFRRSGFGVDWYCNSSNPDGLSFDRAEMERDGLRFMNPVAESRLPDVLSQYAFAVVPTDTLDGASPAAVRAIAELSLPSRIPTLVATSHLPVLVIGHPATSAAGFVRRFALGTVVPYETHAVKNAIENLVRPETQATIRHRAAELSGHLSAEGSADWIWRSLSAGRAIDLRYEELFPAESGLADGGQL